MNKVILYIATSMDGFIADKDGGIDWLPTAEDADDICGYKALMKRVSIIIMGSKSYKQILGFGDWAWKDKHTYVFSSKPHKTEYSNIEFIRSDPKTFMDDLNVKKPNQDIWLLGGAELIKSFAVEKLIDECIITLIPKYLNDGIKLELPIGEFDLISEKLCMDSIIQKTYKRKDLL